MCREVLVTKASRAMLILLWLAQLPLGRNVLGSFSTNFNLNFEGEPAVPNSVLLVSGSSKNDGGKNSFNNAAAKGLNKYCSITSL